MPDEKIPEGKMLRVLCPRCKTPIEIKEKGVTQTDGESCGKADPPSRQGNVNPEAGSDSVLHLDMAEEGVNTCLLCVSEPSRLEKLEGILQEMDFRVFRGSNVASAVSKIHHNSYTLILLDESFDGGTPDHNLVLGHLQLLPMDMRRQLFVCLLSENHPTLDQLAAFGMGVDMILNPRELEKAGIILNRSLKEHFALYRIYKEELYKRG
ncbi:MAG: hypothetical protein GX433_18290 [Deltaproteobacteria bacterium]|nr:hypothetical protein [Deltaproteobacteria bacterium]